MNRNLILGVLVAATTFGCATTQNTPEGSRATANNALNGAARMADTHCLRDTGSRIKRPDGDKSCSPLSGTSYSQDDLDRTGRPDAAEALRALDPRFY